MIRIPLGIYERNTDLNFFSVNMAALGVADLSDELVVSLDTDTSSVEYNFVRIASKYNSITKSKVPAYLEYASASGEILRVYI